MHAHSDISARRFDAGGLIGIASEHSGLQDLHGGYTFLFGEREI